MKLIIGLGNPGKKYQNTRHNLGQSIVKKYVEKFYKIPLQTKKPLISKILQIKQGSQKNIFANPIGYMNNSGISVQKISQFFKIPPSDIYIIHDDLDLEVGKYRIQFNRGPAGHNGIKSIIKNLNTQAFNRIRIGIDKPKSFTTFSAKNSNQDYVLQPFSKKELDIIDSVTPKIFEKISQIINS